MRAAINRSNKLVDLDLYTAGRLDRFGRTLIQEWEKVTGSVDKSRTEYSYDYAGNRKTRDVNGASSLNQAYTYDGLQRLRTLDESTAANDRYWELDQLGNWDEVYHSTSNGGTPNQTRTHNEVNELETVSNWSNPAYDDAGNMTTIPKPTDSATSHSAKYDAWNRLVSLDNGATAIYEYDGLHRRIVRNVTGTSDDRHFYYNEKWQCVEERQGSETTAHKQYVWHPYYIDALACMWWDENDDGALAKTAERYNFLHDANFNVVAVTDSAFDVFNVEERYNYTPYGEVTVLDANFSPDADGKSDVENEFLYTGRRRDPETGLQQSRYRYYHAQLGRFVNRDPIHYWGGMNLYAYVGWDADILC